MIFVCAHGAGGHKDDGAMQALDRTLTDIGLEVVRFNFPYREKGRKIPDPMPVLKESIAKLGANAIIFTVVGEPSSGRRSRA